MAAVAADPDPTAIPGYWYMAAMRSAGDYAITCRVRQMAAALQKRHHKVFSYYFTHQPNTSVNYDELQTLQRVPRRGGAVRVLRRL